MPSLLNDPDLLCQHYLNIVYQNSQGHQSQDRPNLKNIAESYGEILYPSVDTLLKNISIQSHDIFLDAGAGLGKLALQVFLKSAVKAVYGIELKPVLYEQAQHAAQRVAQELPECYQGERQLVFLQGDFLTLPWPNASILLIGSPCFGPAMLGALARRIDATLSIHTVLSLRPLCLLQRLSFTKTIRIEGSWDSALCYVYQPSKA